LEKADTLAQNPVTHASWDLRGKKFVKASSFTVLNVLGLSDCFRRRDQQGNSAEDKLIHLGRRLTAQLRSHGVEIEEANAFTELQGTETLTNTLTDWFKYTTTEDCTVIVLRDHNEDTYAEIRQTADLIFGSQVVCMIGSKVEWDLLDEYNSGLLQYLTNLSMKINLKGAGLNHEIEITGLKNAAADTIVLGADVTHPGVSKCIGHPSIACVVGSIDDKFMTYLGSMRLQANRQEEIGEMEDMVRERLQAWRNKNERLPTRIIFYRDGISESQFESCKATEIPAVKRAYGSLCGSEKEKGHLKLTFAVVGKRHNTRFYARNRNDMVNTAPRSLNTNIKPGLYVDSVVTDPIAGNSPIVSDFYLQAHNAIKGTARSAHYHILLDQNEFDGDDFPNLTHELSYTFGRATKGVSYAAPAYIADRLCERGNVYLRGKMTTHINKEYRTALDENHEPITDEGDLRAWKRQTALEISRSGLWGAYNDDRTNGLRYQKNPWNANLDNTMFWM
jgi:eukaryotic translation initiation factor 2C